MTKPSAEKTWRGYVTNVAEDGAAFTFKPLYGEKFNAVASDSLRPDIAAAHARYLKPDPFPHPYRERALVIITAANAPYPLGAAHVNIAALEPAPINDVIAQLETARHLDDDWCEPGSKAIPHDGIDWLQKTHQSRYPGDIPQPVACPTQDGEFNYEWEINGVVMDLNIDLIARSGDWLRYLDDRASDFEERAYLDLNDPAAWIWIANRIRAAQDGSKPAEPIPALPRQALASGMQVRVAEIPDDHPLLADDRADFRAAEITRDGEISLRGERFEPFAAAALNAPYAAGTINEPIIAIGNDVGEWRVHMRSRAGGRDLPRALWDRRDSALLLHAQKPDGARFCGAFTLKRNATAPHDACKRETWSMDLMQASKAPPTWF